MSAGSPAVSVVVPLFNEEENVPILQAELTSALGGLDYEIAFYSYRIAGEDHIQPAFVDQFGTRTEVSRTIPLISEGEAITRDE